MGGLSLGVREGVIGLIVLVALYMAVVWWRMRRLPPQAAGASAPRHTEPVVAAADHPEEALPVLTTPDDDWERAPAGLAEGILRQGLEQELAQLREEVDSIRGELAGLRADMQQELALLRASQNVSPIYGDAMHMALSGYDATLIAERCGIARAEAELVVALAKSQNA